jgi:hypothetical protein
MPRNAVGHRPVDRSHRSYDPEAEGRGVTLDDFVAYMPAHTYIFATEPHTRLRYLAHDDTAQAKLDKLDAVLAQTSTLSRTRHSPCPTSVLARSWFAISPVVTRALAQIATLPASPVQRREEIRCQVALANALMHTKGYAAPETRAALDQLRA